MANFQALFLDIDGTILQPDDTMQESTKTAVKLMKEKGLEIFLATGRPLHEIADIGEILKINSFIGYNGALAIYDGQDIVKSPMDPNLVDLYIKIAAEKNNELVLYTSSHNLLSNPDSEVTKQFCKKFHLRSNKQYTEDEKANILGITVMNLNEEDIHLYEGFPEIHLSQVNIEGFRHSYDVISDKVNKGMAISTVLKRLNIDAKNAIAFGDGMNDKEMLSVVGEGFAMGNAHEKLFAYAKHTTTSVSDSGIYNGLKTLGLIEE
ncbi:MULTISPECIES: HAD family hydrolase [Bacillaceae]|uniref:HAD family hydrolase n=1 Tax=Bacillaceae TaxID=186817 RepID=UPI001E658711|nr:MULTISPECIES: HAD family hydrolase [Bacillaceae]MCE4047576.1 Cof-type HAD-IIB family hydrolase [Bacillus sp. Au-Bac7]MCM3033861.1 Cof-type HAD-IIB family hydrolase [Niallia sp. MER 6]MDL0436186.1 HAD family hydrolase [Niallia sp. SS-2023]UPO86079.1 Cof-type HAD-IIB family hydrolase [Niallia sp. Man26]